MAEVSIKVVAQSSDLLPALIKSIAASDATQVLVTGLYAFNLFRNNKNDILQGLGKEWSVFGPSDPTAKEIRQLLERFAQAIHDEPTKYHIWFGPTEDYEVRSHLFKVIPSYPYRAAIYVIGLVEDPATYLTGLSVAINSEGRANGHLECIFSTADSLVTDSMRQELKAALGQPNTANRIAWEYMQFLEQIYPHKDAIVDEARKRNIKEFAKSLESLFPKKKWWQFWGKQSKLTKKDKLVEKENSPKEGANSKPYQCKNCLKTFNPGELRNGSFWNVCPYCKGDIWLVSSK